jgi:hypothetical protein
MTTKHVFITVTAAALIGMVLGGLFGLAAGKLAPEFFKHFIPWHDVEPVGFAVFGGATVGVILGGGLGCFGVILQALTGSKKKTTDETKVN